MSIKSYDSGYRQGHEEGLEDAWKPISEVSAEIKQAGTPIIGGTREPEVRALIHWSVDAMGDGFWEIKWAEGLSAGYAWQQWEPEYFQLLPDPSEIPEGT